MEGKTMGNGHDGLDAAGRRAFLASSLAAGAAALAPPQRHGRAAVPPMTVSLADFAGRPGAGRPALVEAFRRGLAVLSRAGGGTLFVPPGAYDFGPVDEPRAILLCRDLCDIAISAYGAVFIANTTAAIMPNMFYFYNFNNVTLAGARFLDQGFTPWVNWRGMYCVGIQADKPSRGLRLVDCRAERVVGLLASNNKATGRHLLSDIHVQGEVRHAYYGVGANQVDGPVSVDLTCHDVRRAFIAYAARHADITVRASAGADWPGSNGLVALVCPGADLGNVEDVRVRVDVSGTCIHSSYVHFYHQGPEREGAMRDIDATVNVVDMRSMTCMFLFDHETHGVQPRTARQWDRIGLHGSLPAGCAGSVVANPSVTSAPGTVRLDRSLARMVRAGTLAAGFRVAPA
jgi:hypothetical protein